MTLRVLATYLILISPVFAVAEEAAPPVQLSSSAADNAEIFIQSPKHNQVVSSPVTVEFGAANISIAPAGDHQPNSGHHHLLIDIKELPDLSMPLPATDQIVHFGKGQTQTVIELAPGAHTLQLLLGNYLHIPHTEPVISETITVIVE